MSYNPRNTVAQQDVIDNINTTAVNLPLSANQGYLLNQRINNIINGSGNGFSASIYTVDSAIVVGLPNLGYLSWDGTNFQPTFTITNSNIDTIALLGTTINSSGPTSISGIFTFSANTPYYLSDDGTLNALIDLDIANSRTVIDAFFESSLSPSLSTYHLTVDCYRGPSGNIIQFNGQLTEYDNPIGQSYITFRWECSSNFAVPVNQPPLYGSWGAGEDNNAQAQSPSLNTTGVIVPATTVFLKYAIDLNGATADRDLNFYIYQNGNRLTDCLMQVPNGSSTAISLLSAPPTFSAGDRLNIGNINSNGATNYQVNILLVASLREDT